MLQTACIWNNSYLSSEHLGGIIDLEEIWKKNVDSILLCKDAGIYPLVSYSVYSDVAIVFFYS
jgi:hypothetical protein